MCWLIQRYDLSIALNPVAKVEHFARRTLDKGDALPPHLMDGTHAFAVRVKRDFLHTGHLLFDIGGNAPLTRHHQERRFGRVAENGPLVCLAIRRQQAGVVAKRHAQQKLPQVEALFFGRPRTDLSFRRIADTADRQPLISDPEIAHGHLILGQRARFVGADDAG